MSRLPDATALTWALVALWGTAVHAQLPTDPAGDSSALESGTSTLESPEEEELPPSDTTVETVPEPAPVPAVPPPPPPAEVEEPTEPPLPPGTFRVGELQLRLDAEARARFEARTAPFLPTAGPVTRGDARLFVESRIRLGLDAQWRHLRVFVQAQDARNYGDVAPGAAAGGSTDFHQGYFELRGEPGYVRVGRQEYALGAERFVGPLAWLAGARSFDGVRAHGEFGRFQPDVFVSWNRAQGSVTDTGGATRDSEGDLLGVLALTTRLESLTLEPYVIYRHVGPSGAAPTGQRDIVHFGARVNGKSGPWIYDVEAALQTGRVRSDRFDAMGNASAHLAGAAVADVGYEIGGAAGLTLLVGGAYGTGASADGDVDELDNFFPTNHLFYGYADLHGLRNTIDGRVRVQLAPSSVPLKLWVDAHVLALANPSARWSNAGGATLGVNPTNDDRLTGGEIDLELRWTPIERFTVWGGYALFLPGPAVEALALPGDDRATDPTHWLYVMAGVALP
ncbi:MAG: alginate export family protein [Sandaracinus sp.]|nr:alginate export family protein [Sandaracinus sp.]MCB9622891.1 alginate export family protein [Sandaracinus sp.]